MANRTEFVVPCGSNHKTAFMEQVIMAECYLTQIGEPFKGRDKQGRPHTMANFRCVCGAEKLLPLSNVRSGNDKSCGCLKIALRSKSNSTHGLSGTPTYSSWSSMMGRCYDPGTKGFEHYGGRGIVVCDRWHSVSAFVADMGYRPSLTHSIDRIDSCGNYEPGNCRWATAREQARNRPSINAIVSYNGEDLCISEWAERLGCRYATIKARLRNGWSIERAVTEPVAAKRKAVS